MPAPKEEVEVETGIGRAVNELSKETLGRDVKSASHSATGSGIDLGVSS